VTWPFKSASDLLWRPGLLLIVFVAPVGWTNRPDRQGDL